MTAIKQFMSNTWTKIKALCVPIAQFFKKVATTCAGLKNKYVYLFLAFALIIGLFAGIGFIVDTSSIDTEIAQPPLDEYLMAWHYAPLYTFRDNYDERYATYEEEFDIWQQVIAAGGTKKQPEEPTYKYDTAMADRITEALKRNYMGEATAMDEFWLYSGINMLNSVSSMLYNQKQTDQFVDAKVKAPFASVFQIVVMIAASLAMIIIVTKSSGRYNIGFAPAFGNNDFWNYLSLATLILTLPTAFYSLIAKSYTWPLLLFISFVFAQVSLAAFGQFTLRKHGMSKMKRFLVSTGVSYAVSIVYFGLGMLNSTGYGTFGAMSLFFPKLLIITVLFIAPLWVNAAYLSNGSIMATALPYACLGITFTIFPGVILTFERNLYSIVLFFLAFVAFIVGALFFTTSLVLKNKKALPFGGDIACEMYEEGAPEITVPEAFTTAQEAKTAAKAEKKAAKNDFAFLDEEPKN